MDNLIYKLINQNVRNADIYQHNGSTWLIFADDNDWVIELTEDNTLWYNYSFFKSIFEFFSIDVVENQHYITKWVEHNIINELNYHRYLYNLNLFRVEGPKPTVRLGSQIVEDTIQNGVKDDRDNEQISFFDDFIENKIKEIHDDVFHHKGRIEGVIKCGKIII